MKNKYKLLFFITLVGYGLVLAVLPYVSVYYTYFAIPILVIFAILGFGRLNNAKFIAAMVFVFTLMIWVVTLLSVTYVGVYLIYITIPILLISALIFFAGAPEP